MPKLMGSSSAIAPVTPIPGRTPVSVPTRTPATQAIIRSQVKHCAKPESSSDNVLIPAPP